VGQYELGKVIGAGAFSKVRLANKAGSKDETFAVKIVLKDSIRDIRDLERSPIPPHAAGYRACRDLHLACAP